LALPQTYARRKLAKTASGGAQIFREKPFGDKLITQLFQLFELLDATLKSDIGIIGSMTTMLRREMGVLSLANLSELKPDFRFWWLNENYATSQNEHDMRLSAVEWACVESLRAAGAIDLAQSYSPRYTYSALTPTVRGIIDTINGRMLEDGFGFQFKDTQLIEITSEFTYSEIVKPALALLADPLFKGADSEFRDAFDEFKARNYDDCIADCGNAFESVIKVIAAQKGWHDVQPTDNAAKLIDAVYRHGLIPSWMQEQMKGLRMMLQGSPTVRNKEASHGAGGTPRDLSKALAAYQLHQTAAAILFLVSQAELS
jgi:hypothetical protein